MMPFVTRAADLAADLAALLPRATFRPSAPRAGSGVGRGSRRGTRCAVATLALGLGLNGIGLCLCAPEPTKARDPHSCCPRPAGHHDAGTPATGTVVTAMASCCPAQMAPGFAARIDDRDILRHTLIATAVTHASPDAVIVPSTIAGSASSLRNTSPPRTTVLRI